MFFFFLYSSQFRRSSSVSSSMSFSSPYTSSPSSSPSGTNTQSSSPSSSSSSSSSSRSSSAAHRILRTSLSCSSAFSLASCVYDTSSILLPSSANISTSLWARASVSSGVMSDSSSLPLFMLASSFVSSSPGFLSAMALNLLGMSSMDSTVLRMSRPSSSFLRCATLLLYANLPAFELRSTPPAFFFSVAYEITRFVVLPFWFFTALPCIPSIALAAFASSLNPTNPNPRARTPSLSFSTLAFLGLYSAKSFFRSSGSISQGMPRT
mmetsp:Transcript_11789/g.28848  ORF Transcript_11789/g.28848 Transcript_11789/m.28848 type:complete len:266 (-) Transcript_11789:707-1504(-)